MPTLISARLWIGEASKPTFSGVAPWARFRSNRATICGVNSSRKSGRLNNEKFSLAFLFDVEAFFREKLTSGKPPFGPMVAATAHLRRPDQRENN